ncbi:MAG: xanthine dehydrogenase family protein molybdopterin-binding subunit [Alphaproteobacteria bacterium]|nr:xanthine dehydrogenase family protein molybdopterin-binding subunit [Alphaproteobacteria bacterium]
MNAHDKSISGNATKLNLAASAAYTARLIDEVETLPPAAAITLGRRGFLKLGAGAGAGLVLAFALPTGKADAAESNPRLINAFVRITPENTVIVYSKGPEIGQGIKTAFGLIIAEELDADWKTVQVEQAQVNSKLYGYQGAGGSTSIPRAWDQLRQAGAGAKAMLVAAAAKAWNVPAGEIVAQDSRLTHKASGKSATYGEFASAAAKMDVPDPKSLKLKATREYRLLGKRYTGVDNHKLVTGQPLFGIDVHMPGMVYASYTKSPRVGGKVESFNEAEIRKMPGVIDVFALEGTGKPVEVMPGVAIVANNTWNAFKAKAALKVKWDESEASRDSISALDAKAKDLAKNFPATIDPKTGAEIGNVDAAFAKAPHVVEAYYDYAFVSHSPLEPMNTTAHWHDGIVEIWSPTQQSNRGQAAVAEMVGLPEDNVVVHQTRCGGGFGRRLMNDYMMEAAAIAQRVKAPVKLQWKREDDFAHDFLRPGGYHQLKGAVDSGGKLDAWQEHFITFTADGKSEVSGGNYSANLPHTTLAPNIRRATSMIPLVTPTGPWRGPKDNAQVFVNQSFMHELALAANRDFVEFLIDVVDRDIPELRVPAGPNINFNRDRAKGVIKLCAEKAGWGRKLPKGRGLGLAWAFSYGGHIAEAVELSVDDKKHITVHKITVVADVGPVVNMSSAENQAQGGAIDGLSTAMGLDVLMEDGLINPSNFNNYPVLRIRSAPPLVEAHFIQSDFRPTGLGEPAVPPLAGALGNAIFDASGVRVRTMPLKKLGYTI